MLLVANLTNTKWCKKSWKWLQPWHMGTHLRVLMESYPMNTNMTGLKWFTKNLCVIVLWTKVASALEGLRVILYSNTGNTLYLLARGYRGSITSGWKEEESCTSELFCVLGRGLPSPKTQNNSRVQDSSSFHPRVIEPLSPTIKRRNLHVLPWS